MSRNASGTYTLPAGNPVVSGSIISSSWANNTMDDIAAALTDSLSRSGSGGMTAALRLFDGTSAVPGMAFVSETGTGAYRAGTGDWRLTVLGSDIIKMTASAVTVFTDSLVSQSATAASTAASYNFKKSRSGSIVQDSDLLGTMDFQGYDGTNYIAAAAIRAQVSGTPGTNDMPGTLSLLTTADGASSLTERFKISNTGQSTFLYGLNETKTAPSISSGTLTLDNSLGNVFSVSLNANITTLSFTNVPATGTAYALTLSLIADGTARTVTWGSAVKWPAATAPTLTSTNGKVDTFVLVTWDAGTTWYAFVAGQNS